MTITNTQVQTPTISHDPKVLDDLKSTSAKIRYLATKYPSTEKGAKFPEDRGRIAKILGIKYQWVRNVLNTPLKK